MTVTHKGPSNGKNTTPCCGKTPYQLPQSDRMTYIDSTVTCGRPAALVEEYRIMSRRTDRQNVRWEFVGIRTTYATLAEVEEYLHWITHDNAEKLRELAVDDPSGYASAGAALRKHENSEYKIVRRAVTPWEDV